MSETAITALKELADYLTPLVEAKKISKKIATVMVEKIEAVQTAITDPRALGDVPRRVISSFEDWEERVFDVVEFVRPDNTLVQFKIQSVTTAELRSWKGKRNATAPIQPQPRSKGDGPDLNDPHYKKEMLEYEKKMIGLEEHALLWVLEAGLVDIKIPGSTDEEKLGALQGKVAGDWTKIGQDILSISNLAPESLRPFSMG